MRFADQRAVFNRRVVNRVVRPLSGRFGLWSLIEHRGRRSGTTYRTPVTMFRTGDGVAIVLPYGRDRDWVRNVLAANGARVVMSGESFEVTDPRVVSTTVAAAQITGPWRAVVERLRSPSTLVLRRS